MLFEWPGCTSIPTLTRREILNEHTFQTNYSFKTISSVLQESEMFTPTSTSRELRKVPVKSYRQKECKGTRA